MAGEPECSTEEPISAYNLMCPLILLFIRKLLHIKYQQKFFNHFCIFATKCSYNISSSLQSFYDLKCEIII